MPGHTLGHIAYYFTENNESLALFTGDTLFSAGCGRLFDGTFAQLYHSLLKLRALPCATLIYCGHEYTLSNLQFAHWLEKNAAIELALKKAKECIAKNQPTLPSTLTIECAINPFLRCDNPLFMESMQKRFQLEQINTPLELFKYLRLQKDHWSTTRAL